MLIITIICILWLIDTIITKDIDYEPILGVLKVIQAILPSILGATNL